MSSCATVSANNCNRNLNKGKCIIKIDQLRPTQYSLGMLSINSKVEEIYSNFFIFIFCLTSFY